MGRYGMGWYVMVCDGWGMVYDDMRWKEMVWDGMG